jgi:hypothetical protein
VLVLVMTLLSVLFVIGIAFLATMNFEAEMIGAQQQRDRNRVSVGAVFDEFGSSLRAGLMVAPGVPFGGKPVGESLAGFAQLPGVHNLAAPIEPYETADGRFVFPSITDARSLSKAGPHDGWWWRALRKYEVHNLPVEGIVAVDANIPGRSWLSGVPLIAVRTDPNDVPLGPTVDIVPVDADGDGISDTLQFPLRDPASNSQQGLGFSRAQVASVARQLNTASNPTGEVYLGLRVIAHGGMVNLNESHPNLIANVFDIGVDVLKNRANGPEVGFFKHRPSFPDPREQAFYTPLLEEPILRRRGLLLPRVIAPSLLHGNALLDPDTDSFGDADMWMMLFPPRRNDPFNVGFETVYEGRHTYTPFTPDDYDSVADAPVWPLRMEPFTSYAADANGEAYDRRHLVTTISYDDLLSRGGTGGPGGRDLLALMRQANQAVDPGLECPNPLPFEYADYPHDMPNRTKPNDEGDECDTDNTCRDYCLFDSRKGRLLLSLPWLDEAADAGFDERLRNRLIHDVFFLLVRNASGPYWDDIDCSAGGTDGVCPGGEFCDMNLNPPLCVDLMTRQRHSLSMISRTAASLTANLIDYMDFDDSDGDGVDDNTPTPIALRSFDFDDPGPVGGRLGWLCQGGVNNGQPCDGATDCLGGGALCLPTVEAPVVYGLERQPFITEVATQISPGPIPPPAVIDWGVELFNPYQVDIDLGNGYFLVEINGTAAGYFTRNEIPLSGIIPAGQFIAFVTSAGGMFATLTGTPGVGRIVTLPAATPLRFENGWIIYLVRNVDYPDPGIPGGSITTSVVLDQFSVSGSTIGVPILGPLGPTVSMQRAVAADVFWKAPVPIGDAEVPGETLGTWNGDDAALRPVEVNFANTGSFTRPHPADADFGTDQGLGVAFPTTGSLLLLTRHANRQLSEEEYTQTTDLAFTTWLDDVTVVDGVAIREDAQIDNGRMPLFDTGGPSLGGRYAHHVHPAMGACCRPGNVCVEVFRLECDTLGGDFFIGAGCSTDTCEARHDAPGGVRNLPWGQFVFDYFTALPLSSVGPYTNPDPADIDFEPGVPESIPRVDLDGLRVHGRIDINAAPWKVLAGLPLMPMERFPKAFRDKIETFAGAGRVCHGGGNDGLPCENDGNCGLNGVCAAASVGDALAQGIVAYRELREVVPGGIFTGNYGDPGNASNRDWEAAAPAFRRGTGFLTVGELANVRHGDAAATPVAGLPPWYSLYRSDAGMIGNADPNEQDYVSAIAVLASLGDWMTVRSQVFTVYGVIRGEGDPEIGDPLEQARDVDSRALRFQETVDRLPTFFGEPVPVRIGERVIRRYSDVGND